MCRRHYDEWRKAQGMRYQPDEWERIKTRQYPCSIEGCDKTYVSRPCQMHKRRMQKYGTYDLVLPCMDCGAHVPEAKTRPVRCHVCTAARQQRACIECGVSLPVGARVRLCSDACRKAREKRWVATNRPPMPKRITSCPHCGSSLETRGRKTYCTSECADRAAHSRRRAREAGAYVEDVWRSRVYERDGYTCQLCHKAVRMDEAVPHPKAPTLDHVVPLIAGGKHEYANVQLAHFICNSVKSAGDAQLGLNLIGVASLAHQGMRGRGQRRISENIAVPLPPAWHPYQTDGAD